MQSWKQKPIDKLVEDQRVHGTVGRHRCSRALAVDRLYQCRCLPVSVWHCIDDSLDGRPPTISPCHIGFGACFVKKQKLGKVQASLRLFPSSSRLLHVWAFLLGRV